MHGGVVLGNEEEGTMDDTLLRFQAHAAFPRRSRTPRRRRLLLRECPLSPAAVLHLVAGIRVWALSAAQRPGGPHHEALGCYRDADMGGGARVIPSLEHSDERLNGNYKVRRNAVAECAAVAWDRGFPGFVIQDGGWCGSCEEVCFERFNMWGSGVGFPPPYGCTHGTGGLWSNDVYRLVGKKQKQGGGEL